MHVASYGWEGRDDMDPVIVEAERIVAREHARVMRRRPAWDAIAVWVGGLALCAGFWYGVAVGIRVLLS